MPTSDPHADARTDVIRLLDDLAEAWNRGDAEAYGDLFTEEASYVTYVGTHYRGRADIVASHRALFETFLKGTRLSYELVELHRYGTDTAVVVTRGENAKGTPKRLTKVQSYTLVREDDGEWRVAAFHNTKRKTLMERISFVFAPATRPQLYGTSN